METLRIYLYIISAAIKSKLEYKTSFILYIFAILFYYFGQLGILVVILSKFEMINGWRYGEIAFLFGLLSISQAFTTLLFNSLSDFEQSIILGDFDRTLIRPLSPLCQILCSKFEASYFAHIIIGSITIVYGSLEAEIQWSFIKIFFFPIVVTGAVLIQGGIRIIIASVTFWTLKNSSLVHTIVYSSKEFILYPVSIYNYGVQFFLTFIFPLAFVNYYPSHYFLEKDGTYLFNSNLQYFTPVVGIITYLIAMTIWRTGINHYQSTGS